MMGRTALIALLALLSPSLASATPDLSFLCRLFAAEGVVETESERTCADYLGALGALDDENGEVEAMIERARDFQAWINEVPSWPLEVESETDAGLFREWIAFTSDQLEADLLRLNTLVEARERFLWEAYAANELLRVYVARLRASDDIWDLPKAVVVEQFAFVDIAAEGARFERWRVFQRELAELASSYYGAEVVLVQAEPPEAPEVAAPAGAYPADGTYWLCGEDRITLVSIRIEGRPGGPGGPVGGPAEIIFGESRRVECQGTTCHEEMRGPLPSSDITLAGDRITETMVYRNGDRLEYLYVPYVEGGPGCP